MPYYCTVPRCTSMAGKAKNVSFHQFPKNEELADLWNNILKRGKPYTKYSKVCSLHFRPEDYTITSVGKNKGQWRSLRKDAIPSQNLPDETPSPHQGHQRRSSTPAGTPSLMDPKVQQQVAQAIYMQTMLAMQAAAYSETDQRQSMDLSLRQNGSPISESDGSGSTAESDPGTPVSTTHNHPDDERPHSSTSDISELQQFLFKYSTAGLDPNLTANRDGPKTNVEKTKLPNSFKCNYCSKYFKDPDVFLIHQRSHRNELQAPTAAQKENVISNTDSTKTLLANPILANLLKPDDTPRVSDANANLEKLQKLKTAMALNMEAYIKDVATCYKQESDSDSELSLNESKSPTLVIDESVQKNWRL